jgi:hypothetical protein
MGEDLPQHWSSEIEINDSWDTVQVFERIVKYHTIPVFTKYIRSYSLLCAPDIDGWRMKNLLHRIFLSSDPENEDLKVLVYDCLYIPWIKGDFLPEFAPEYTGSYLIFLPKPSLSKLQTTDPDKRWCFSLSLFPQRGRLGHVIHFGRRHRGGIQVDEDFETTVHELRTYFGFFKLAHTCESILRFYSYNWTTNYLKLKTGGLQGDPSKFMVFCLVTLHLWGQIFKMFPELRALAYTDDETTIGRLSQVLKLAVVSKSLFKSDDNLDFNMDKTVILAKDPTARHVYE